jgi:hypothetical protein
MAFALACAALMPATASAQVSDRWEYGASLYGWFPSVSGKTTLPPPADGGSNISVDADDILSNLKFVFMGMLQARKGRWGAFTDVIYMDIGDTKSQTREFSLGGTGVPAGVSGDLDYDLKAWLWTIAGEYRAVVEPGREVDIFAGARMADVEQKLAFQLTGDVGSIPLPERAGHSSVSVTNWDAIVGVKGRFALGADRTWFVPYYLDVGTGESDLTWQAMGGIGYSFTWGSVVAAWRYLDYDLGGPVEDLTFSGPAISLSFRW